MGKLKYSSRVTRRDILAKSGRLASAAPVVTLLLSAASAPGTAVAQYAVPTPFPNTGMSLGSGTSERDVKVDPESNEMGTPLFTDPPELPTV